MKIEVKNVYKKFKNEEVLKDIDITFEKGKVYGLFGRNGSGKSVLQKLIAGIYVPTSGSILYDGVDITKEKIYPLCVRVLIEKPSFFPDLTGFENLKILAEIQNTIGPKEIDRALEIVNLFDEKDKRYSKYSLGMKQKLGIAQAIMEDYDVLILDEPFNGIERESVKKIIDYLLEKKKEGKIIIVSSHIKDDLQKLADIFYEVDSGKVTKRNYEEL